MMRACNECSSICQKAHEGELSFLFNQLEICESCVYKKEVSKEQQNTYESVRLNYVKAYWVDRLEAAGA
jgi:DNA-directed RNA polymerase subunit M/transcription elongation factor TFIIS